MEEEEGKGLRGQDEEKRKERRERGGGVSRLGCESRDEEFRTRFLLRQVSRGVRSPTPTTTSPTPHPRQEWEAVKVRKTELTAAAMTDAMYSVWAVRPAPG